MEKSQILVVAVIMVLMFEVSAIRFGSNKSSLNFCNLNEDDLMACKPAVTKSNTPVAPTSGCCTSLAKANLTCLCSYKDSMMMSVYGIDSGLAMQLPVKCGLSTSPPTC
ncbi:hypothetical protein ACHQM5_028087 [Ranunculus cassubicifolius]